jgi:hypothetical protein
MAWIWGSRSLPGPLSWGNQRFLRRRFSARPPFLPKAGKKRDLYKSQGKERRWMKNINHRLNKIAWGNNALRYREAYDMDQLWGESLHGPHLPGRTGLYISGMSGA